MSGIVICDAHDPPVVFSVEDSLIVNSWDDCCPLCERDDSLIHDDVDMTVEEYVRQFGGTAWTRE